MLKFFPIPPIRPLKAGAVGKSNILSSDALPGNREIGNTMPVDFGDITAFHHEEAARHYALAQAARDRGSFAEAEFQTGLGARWDEVAQEQKIGMRQMPSRRRPKQMPNRRPPQPTPMTFAADCLPAVVRGVKRIAAAIRQFVVKRSAPVDGLPLR